MHCAMGFWWGSWLRALRLRFDCDIPLVLLRDCFCVGLASLHYWLSVQMSSQNDFFLSHTQRDAEAKVIAQMLYSGMKDLGKTCWLDVMMQARDINAMKEGVINCKCLIAIITDNGKDSYFSRDMCRQVRHIFIAVACLFVFDDINVRFVVYVCVGDTMGY